jgi:hypothetical protein
MRKLETPFAINEIINDAGYIISVGDVWSDMHDDPEHKLEIVKIEMDVYTSGDKKGETFHTIIFDQDLTMTVYAEMLNGTHYMPKNDEQIVINRIRTPDQTILTSRHVHDYCYHIDKQDEKRYAVDGGFDYLRREGFERGALGDGFVEMSVTTRFPFIQIREALEWGRNTTKEGEILPDTDWLKLSEISDDHLNNIIERVHTSQTERSRVNNMYLDLMKKEQVWRRMHHIKVPDGNY